MASSNKPALLFVHGAFHGPDCFDALISPLKDAEYFGAIRNDFKLPSAELNSSSSFQRDIDHLRATVLHILDGSTDVNGVAAGAGSDCVVVMHSYGAAPAAEALRGLGRSERGAGKTAVVKMVYLSCNIPRAGDSVVGQVTAWSAERGLPADLPLEAIGDGVLKFVGEGDVFYNGLPKDQQATLLANLSTHSAASLNTPLKGSIGSMAYDTIPGWYLLCKKDNILPEALQRECIRVVGNGMERVEEIDTGHSPFLVEPEIVADFIVRAAKSAES